MHVTSEDGLQRSSEVYIQSDVNFTLNCTRIHGANCAATALTARGGLTLSERVWKKEAAAVKSRNKDALLQM